ncbi:hypothetical protein HGG75_09015 [Ochrobactrum pseudogrignonense]|nr:hypothetical protein [Brucella pseudogrignonensis]
MSRVAARNGTVNAEHFGSDIQIPFSRIIAGDLAIIERLADIAGVDSRALLEHRIQPRGTRYDYRGQRLEKNQLCRANIRVCPLCLCDDVTGSNLPADIAMFGRAIWTIKPIETCIRHHTALVRVGEVKAGERPHDFSAILLAGTSMRLRSPQG